MSKRLLSMTHSQIESLSSKELLKAIALSEGRIMAGECVCSTAPLLNDITNAEVVASMSADILILNIFDVDNPLIQGLPECREKDTIRKLKELTGRIIGINLEPTENKLGDEALWRMTKGRMASAENARKAKEMGVDILVITGNPGNSVSNKAIVSAIREIRNELRDEIILITGKMHASGIREESGEKIVTKEDVEEFIDAGADIILLPAPGTVPGISESNIHELISYIHEKGKLAMTSIGTSQEGADTDTIRRIALMAKAAGADIHHIGDSGYVGMALPENIMAYSIAIRGVRHTYHQMGQSINR